MTQQEKKMLGAGPLAYLGDSVLETMLREKLIATGISDVGRLNGMARAYEKATAQSAGLEKLLPLLDEEETAVFLRGRNGVSSGHPKSATAQEYRRATGFEALFGYLYVMGRTERLRQLFDVYTADFAQS